MNKRNYIYSLLCLILLVCLCSCNVVFTSSKLDTPVISLTEKTVSWNKVDLASSYDVYINNQFKENVVENSYTIVTEELGEYEIYIIAKPATTENKESAKSNKVVYTYKITLDTPVITLTENTVSWQDVKNATGYEVYVDDVLADTVDTTSKVINQLGTKTVYVVAVSTNPYCESSSKSNEVTVSNYETLAAPVISLNVNTVSWEQSDKASAYEIYVNGSLVETVNANDYVLEYTQVGQYSVKVKAKGDNQYYIDSEMSNTVVYEVLPTALATPVISIEENVVSWSAVEHAESYEVYLNNELIATVTNCEYEIIASIDGTYEVKIKALTSNASYCESEYSNVVAYIYEAPVIPSGWVIEGNESSYYNAEEVVVINAETFTGNLVLVGASNKAVYTTSVDPTCTKNVWLTLYAKAKTATNEAEVPSTMFKLSAVYEGYTYTLIDWYKVGGTSCEVPNMEGGYTVMANDEYEIFLVRLDTVLAGCAGKEVEFILEQKDSEDGLEQELSVVGFKLSQKDSIIGNDSPYQGMNAWVTNWTEWVEIFDERNDLPIPGGWLRAAACVSDEFKYQGIATTISFPALEERQTLTFDFIYSNYVNYTSMIHKLIAVDAEGNVYTLVDWDFFQGPGTDVQKSYQIDLEVAQALSGKSDVTLIWQFNDSQKIDSVSNNRMYITNMTFGIYNLPNLSSTWTITSGEEGSYYDPAEIVGINSDSFAGNLVLKGGYNKATYNMTISEEMNSNVWLTLFAKAKTATNEAEVPSTMFKLSLVFDEQTYTLIDWYKVGGTSCEVPNMEGGYTVMANDEHEIFLISFDNILLDYAGKEVEFILEQKDSEDGSEQELSVTGFGLSQKSNIVGNNSPYAGLSSWVTNYTEWVEWVDMPIPAGWLRAGACVQNEYKYQGLASVLNMPTVSNGQTLSFDFVYSNYGNYTSMVHKLIAIDDEGNVYTLVDWDFFQGPGTDVQKTYTINSDVAQALSGKSNVTLIWQFNDSQKIDSVFNNRMYITNVTFNIQ